MLSAHSEEQQYTIDLLHTVRVHHSNLALYERFSHFFSEQSIWKIAVLFTMHDS